MAKNKIPINFRIRPQINAKLEKIAESKEITKSELLREIIENYVKLL